MARLLNELLRHVPDRIGTAPGRRCLEHAVSVFFTRPRRSDEVGTAIQSQGMFSAPVKVGARAWLGMRVLLLPGVEVGSDAIVASGAVVTRSIPARAVAAGVPARVIGER